jgi:hypothetical protein
MRIVAIDALMWRSGRIGGSLTIGWFVARIDDLPDQPDALNVRHRLIL